MEEAVLRDGVPEIRRLNQFEDENVKLKRLVEDLTLDRAILPYVAKNLRSGATSSLQAYELDENGLAAASQKFDLHHEGRRTVGLVFIANYLTNAMRALYDARAAQQEIKQSAASRLSAPSYWSGVAIWFAAPFLLAVIPYG